MNLAEVLREECIVPGLIPGDKASVLREVAAAAKRSPLLENVSESDILAALEEREALGSTGFGKGIAIPHCRIGGVEDFVVGILTVADGVAFDALDGEAVRIIVFIVGPEGQARQHLRLLSAISHTLMVEGAVDEVLAETTPIGVRDSFVRHSHLEIDAKDRRNKSLFHVFVQDEAVFREIIEVLSVTGMASLVVLDAENTGRYLSRIPLFADFLRDEPSGFCRVVMVVVDRRLSNETLRRIESVTGNLDENTGCMVTVQDVFYAGGSLAPQ